MHALQMTFTQRKSADLGRGPRFGVIVAFGGQTGLGDDQGSLQKNGGGDRCEQRERGGGGEQLGHLIFPRSVSWLLIFRCRSLPGWMRIGESFSRQLLLTKTRARQARVFVHALRQR
jgi:hypothetical protein